MENETIDWQLNCTRNCKVEVRTKYAPYVVILGKIWYVDYMADGNWSLAKYDSPNLNLHDKIEESFFDGILWPEGTTEYGWVEVFQKLETRVSKIQSDKRPLKPYGEKLDPDEFYDIMEYFVGDKVLMRLNECSESDVMLIKPDHKLEYDDGILREVEYDAVYEFI